MALPLLWLGAAALSAMAVKGLADDRKQMQKQRGNSYRAKTLLELDEYESPVACYPSDLFSFEEKVKPNIGSIVCCGIGGVLDHSGIWIGENTIVELAGNGLVKAVSSERFIEERSGKHIFVACDSTAFALGNDNVAENAIAQIYQYKDYHLIKNNCHQFIWDCFANNDKQLTTLKSLSIAIAHYHNRVIYWDVCDC